MIFFKPKDVIYPFCKDCKYATKETFRGWNELCCINVKVLVKCGSKVLSSEKPAISCYEARNSNWVCGLKGRFWESNE